MNQERDVFLQHYKGGLYRLLGSAVHTETNETFFIYRSINGGTIWARPASMFSEEVEYEGEMVPRFRGVSWPDQKKPSP